MMKNIKINKLGEFNVFDNNIEYVSPLSNFKDINTNKRKLSDDYNEFLHHTFNNNTLCPISYFSERGKFIQFNYDLDNVTAYSSIRYLDFERQLELFQSVADIADYQGNNNVQILWDMNNFVIAHSDNEDEKDRVKAILYNFSDFIVYDKTSALAGLKQLIILGLTNLYSVTTKPNKVDFINKSDEVIGFAEEVINARDINSIRNSIETRLEQFRLDREEKERMAREVADEREKKSRFKKRKSTYVEPVYISNKEKLARELGTAPTPVKTQNKKKEKITFKSMTDYFLDKPIRVIPLVLLAAFIMIFPSFIENNGGGKAEKIDKLNAQLNVQKKINDIFSDYINDQRQKAKQEMATIDYNKLTTKKQKDIYIKWLLEDGKYTKAMSLNKNSAYLVGQMINKDNRDEIEKVATREDNNVLAFFLASYDNRYQEMINLANKVDLKELTVTNEIVKSYILTNQFSELDNFIDDVKKKYASNSKEVQNINNTKNYYQTYIDPLKETKEQIKGKEKEVNDLKAKATAKKSNNKSEKEKKKDNTKSELSKVQSELKALEEKLAEQESKIENIQASDIKGA